MLQTKQETYLVDKIRHQLLRELRAAIVCFICKQEFVPMDGRTYCSKECQLKAVKRRAEGRYYGTDRARNALRLRP